MLPKSFSIAAIVIFLADTIAGPVSRDTVLNIPKRDIPNTHNLHERHISPLAHQWTKKEKIPRTVKLPMRIGLRQVNLAAGEEKLLEILKWLIESGISADRIGQSVNKQWVQFDASVEEVESLLYADFFLWEHTSGSEDIAAEEYHIPIHIQEHIDYVTPGIRLRTGIAKTHSNIHSKKRAASLSGRPDASLLSGFPHPNSTTCSIYVTEDCTRAQYSIPHGTTGFPGNQLGIFESANDHYSRQELDVYFSTLYPYIPNGTWPEERLIDGAVGAIEDPSNLTDVEDGAESALDFNSAIPLIYPQGTVLFQEDDQWYKSHGGYSGFWNTFLDAIDGSYCTYSAFGETGNCTDTDCLDPVYPDPNPGGYKGELQCGVYKPTNVISISYHQLALQGITIVTSSGDVGVGQQSQCGGAERQIFSPHSAASCPYVLAKLNEVATTRFASGGGFSQIFGTPGYQQQAVTAYFDQVESSLPFSGYNNFVINGNYSSVTSGVYHRGGRGYPDVAAVGDRQVVFTGGKWQLIGGTSLSSPAFASVITLINEARLEAGKSTLGYLHPVLYANPQVFHDVTVGQNPGCNNSPGFPAATGWDPVSGLGTPNFPALMDLLVNL
ncbi:subtilisin-like protein [Trichoderma asperelloides]|nr:subtilisin-like protein [Trichoderma asperelloides]